MSDLGWTADGIERAEACGGVPLEVYRRPGFVRQKGVRRSDRQGGGGGLPADTYSDFKPDIEIVGRQDPLPR